MRESIPENDSSVRVINNLFSVKRFEAMFYACHIACVEWGGEVDSKRCLVCVQVSVGAGEIL